MEQTYQNSNTCCLHQSSPPTALTAQQDVFSFFFVKDFSLSSENQFNSKPCKTFKNSDFRLSSCEKDAVCAGR